MKFPLAIALLTVSLLPLHARDAGRTLPARERAYFGVVTHAESKSPGVEVSAVAPAGPAGKAGIRAGDWLLRVGQVALRNREDLRRVMATLTPGEVIPVELLRDGQHLTLRVVLEKRPLSSARQATPESSLGADRRIRPISLPEDIRQQMRSHRRTLRLQLASLPDGLTPVLVTAELNAIRDLARDAHARMPGWMSGRAGEISVRFRDAEGSVVLYGANNLVILELYSIDGQLEERFELNTEQQRRSLPAAILERLQRLR